MDGLGLGYDALAATNGRLVYASISGFGQTGSFAGRRAYGATAHAEAGWLWVQQQAQGGDAPFAPGVTVADIVTGMSAFSAIVAALLDREHTGRGQRIDTTLMDCQLAMLSEVAVPALNGATEAAWSPFRHPIHATRDGGHVTINIGDARNFARIADALGHSGEPMPTPPPAANTLVGQWVAALPTDAVARAMDRTGAPYGVVKSMPEAAAHPYFAERGMIAEVPDGRGGALRVVNSPLRFSDATAGPTAGPPIAGEHTREVLGRLGYADDRVDALLESGAVGEQLPER
jgi:succinate--hydroxymethylglutarate CoA-transferase